MPLPTSGAISLANIRSEQGGSGAISLGDSSVRALLGVSSGAISLSNGYGKSAWTLTFSSSDGQGSGTVYDGTSLSSSAQDSAAVYLTSNPACVWNIALSQGGTINTGSSPANGQSSTGASFYANASGSGYKKFSTDASWSVSASYGGKTISFTVSCYAGGTDLDNGV